jgi:hypothetical protein
MDKEDDAMVVDAVVSQDLRCRHLLLSFQRTPQVIFRQKQRGKQKIENKVFSV